MVDFTHCFSDLCTDLNDKMRKAGCSPLFVSSAINSAVFGELARQQGFSMKLDDLAFKERLIEQDRLDTIERNYLQVHFRKDSYLLGQRYLRTQTAIENENRQKLVEYQYFDAHCWKSLMATSIHAFYKEQQLVAQQTSIIPIKLLIAKTDINSSSSLNVKEYSEFCSDFIDKLGNCQYLDYMPSQWKHRTQSCIADAMIINYVLQGIPTIILFPYSVGGRFRIESAVWGFNRGLGSISFGSFFENKKSIYATNKEDVIAQLALVAGVLIDTYLSVENHASLIYFKRLRKLVEDHPVLEEFYNVQYKQLAKKLELLNSDKTLGGLFSEEERGRVNSLVDEISYICK